MHAATTHSTIASDHSVRNGIRLDCFLVVAFPSANALADGGAGFPTWPALGELFVTIGSFAVLYLLIWAVVIFAVCAVHIVALIFVVKAIVKKDLRSKGLWWSVLALLVFYAAIGFIGSDLSKETNSEFKAAPDTRPRWQTARSNPPPAPAAA